MLGGLLLESAAQRGMNVMLETSGKDIASFHYVNYFFPSSHYRKLVVYFEINDVKHAEQSVDGRMKREMERGRDLVSRQATTVRDLMAVNCGGPYGGKQLCAVEAAARATWDKVTNPVLVGGGDSENKGKEENESDAWSEWLFARIAIRGGSDPAWMVGRTAGALHSKSLPA